MDRYMNLGLFFSGLFAWALGVVGCAASNSLGQEVFFMVVAFLGLISIGASVFYTKE